jgi:hypothetical protein
MGGRPRAHTPGLLPAGRTERIVGETRVCPADARARGRTARTRARRKRPERAHACCRPPAALRACVAPRHRCAGLRADAARPPQKQRTRWQLVPPGAARARPRRRRARPPRREAAACPLPVVAPMVCNLAKNVPKGPRAGHRKICTAVPRERSRIDHSSQTCFRGWPKMFKKMSGTSPWASWTWDYLERKRSKKE